MRNPYPFLVIVVLFSLVSCDDDIDCCLPLGDLENLLGSWQVYERGYSPGAGYIVEDVPAEPAQLLSFESDNRFTSNYSGLEDFSHFRVLKDNDENHFLALYKSKRDMKKSQDVDNLGHSDILEFEEGRLKLYFRYCIEGCHIGLKR